MLKCVMVLLMAAVLGTALPAEFADDPIYAAGMRDYAEENVYGETDSLGNAEASTVSPFTDLTYQHDARFVGTAYTVRNGIDVSSHQGTIDWGAAAADGVEFAMIRAGLRGYGAEGYLKEDAQFGTNISGAKNAGVKVGVYFFSQALNETEAAEEAKTVLSYVNGAALDLPIVMDYEDEYASDGTPGRLTAAKLSKEAQTANAQAFCRTIEAAGYRAGVYTNYERFFTSLDGESLGNEYSIWLADWRTDARYVNPYEMWQYSDSGTVSGISGKVDCDFWYEKTGTSAAKETRIAGGDRYETAAKTAAASFPEGNSTAVIASGENWPDALAASALAGVKNCPLLLTEASSLNAYTLEMLRQLGVTQVYLVGGTGALSENVQAELVQNGISADSILRLGGDSRTETADKIAAEVMSGNAENVGGAEAVAEDAGNVGGAEAVAEDAGNVGGEEVMAEGTENAAGGAESIGTGLDSACIIVSGNSFPDALSISAYAYAQKMPVLLTGSDGKLTAETLKIAESFQNALIIGREGAVSGEVEGQLAGTELAAAQQASGAGDLPAGAQEQLASPNVVRYGGDDRYETSEIVIEQLFNGAASSLVIATGENFPDALAGSALAGKAGGAVLLVNGKGSGLTERESSIIGKADRAWVLGGTQVISNAVEKAAAAAMESSQ